jgi:hypothetical protein
MRIVAIDEVQSSVEHTYKKMNIFEFEIGVLRPCLPIDFKSGTEAWISTDQFDKVFLA